MPSRMMPIVVLALCAAAPALTAQVPIAFGPLEPPAALPPEVRAAVVAHAIGYPFMGFRGFGRDSVLLVFDDSTLTSAALEAQTWMFGPPVTAAEADSSASVAVLSPEEPAEQAAHDDPAEGSRP